MDNIVAFKPKANVKVAEVNDKEAWDNLQTLKNIIQSNIDILLSGDPDKAWFILASSSVESMTNGEGMGFACGYYAGRLQAILDKLESDDFKSGYLQSNLPDTLVGSMAMMATDHLTPISFEIDNTSYKLVLHRTWDTWGMVNLYQDHISVHRDMVSAFVEKYDNV